MNKGLFQRILPHLIAVGIFLVVAVIYCRPVLQGQVLFQSDVTQWKAMAQNSFEYKEKHGHFPLWTNGMFSGMPAYQIALEPEVATSPSWFYGIFSLFLPKPISFFFLACVCFYFLSQVLRTRSFIGIIGALAYAYVTYNAIIVAEGHDTKMLTIGLMPGFIASLILIYNRQYLWGAALTTLFTALMIGLIHMQIVYYSLIIAFFMTIAYLVRWIRAKEYKHLALALSIAIASGVVGVLANAVQILTTFDSSKTTIRGGSQLADSSSSTSKEGLNPDYALSYSMYKTEPFVMMVPKMYGGSNKLEVSEEDSKAIDALRSMPQQAAQQLQYALSFYWGGIGGTSGPPYVGAIICFLALIGFFLLDNKHKWWILGTTVLALMMSWGEYFLGFNQFLLENLPMYNKFRAPSMILVIPTFLFCMMAILVLQKIADTDNKEALWEKYKKGLMLTGGVFVVLFLVYFNSDFKSASDTNFLTQMAGWEYLPNAINFFNALEEDRQGLFMGSLLRSLFFIGAAALILWLVIRKKFQALWAIIILGALSFIDVMVINSKYLNEENYQEAMEYESNFAPSPADQQIMQDTGYYRVLDLRQGVRNAFNGGALTMYHHHSVGGYHPAKLSIYQDLIEHQLYKFPQSLPAYNMLNTKYVIQQGQDGQVQVIPNPDALGPVWFVNAVKYESTPRGVMNALTNFNPRDTAVVFTEDQKLVVNDPGTATDSIWLKFNDNDDVAYGYNSSSNRFAVFSEVFFDKGWKAYVDGKELPIIRTNYVLRGLSLPAGQNKEIKFEFRPASFYTGEKIALVAGIVLYLLLVAAIVQSYRKRNVKKGGVKA